MHYKPCTECYYFIKIPQKKYVAFFVALFLNDKKKEMYSFKVKKFAEKAESLSFKANFF